MGVMGYSNKSSNLEELIPLEIDVNEWKGHSSGLLVWLALQNDKSSLVIDGIDAAQGDLEQNTGEVSSIVLEGISSSSQSPHGVIERFKGRRLSEDTIIDSISRSARLQIPCFAVGMKKVATIHKSSSIPLQQTAILMKAVVSSSSTPPLASTSSDSIFNSFAPTPLSRLQALQLLETDALKILPEEIVNLLSSLQNLSVGYCPNSTSLQRGIGNLSTLGSLEISECPNLVTLPQEISNLSSLKSLHIERCYKLESMPGEMHRLISLIKLHISQCPNLESLPEGISNLSSLVVLSIVACRKLVSLPQGMHGLTALNALSIIRCFNLKSLSKGKEK
ncbi:hypothetical protein FEM48_Zijuj05G0024900 [Ziziphus jujuba var. spinosa]|uniref:Disease resistance R13L4/SHOC-2-like LRR domain-containing protein n=1 Tax=Ziziphus jujuba var. spinosa TaxID=714518 RepID=A0A978VCA5_ZIZJJ|nr:hypothetical protein FEM48_Zijuj05G0024900 [Ziziphus jujuba var. spinosa]